MSFMDAINQAIVNAAQSQAAAQGTAAPVQEAAVAGAAAGGAGGAAGGGGGNSFWGALAPNGQPIDVEAVLNARMQGRGGPALNWRTSIADLSIT